MGKKWVTIFAIVIFVGMLPIHNINAAEDINYAKGLSDELSALCKGIQNSGECADKVEAYQLRKGVAGVARNGKQLMITLASGKKITFTDNNNDTNGKWYRYAEYLPTIKYHLIDLQYNEGGGFVFLGANNGKYEVIEDIPLISPGLKRIATINWCDAFCNPGIVIIQMTDKNIIKEFSLKPKEYWFSGSLQWLDDNNIKVSIKVWSAGYKKTEDKHFLLIYSDNGWATKGY